MQTLSRIGLISFCLAIFLGCTQTSSDSSSKKANDSSNDSAEQQKQPPEAVVDKPHYVVLLISGFDSDPTVAQIAGTARRGSGNSGTYQLMGDLKKNGIDCKFFNWNGTNAGKTKQKPVPGHERIENWIRELIASESTTRLIIVGHSWGGHSAIEVLNKFQDDKSLHIPLVLFLDPSSAMRGTKPDKLPKNIDRLVSYYTNNAFCWGRLRDDPRIENISLGDPKNGYLRTGGPKYDSMLDIGAHNAAEWDQKIHSDIVSRILSIAKTQDAE